MEKLYCNNSKVSALDLTKYPRLTELNCSGNKWFRLDVSQCRELTKLFAAGCNLTKVDLSKNKKLREEVQLHVNCLKALQFSATDLHTLTLFDNEIEGKAMTAVMQLARIHSQG
ncbi:leucine-rich repeat domain-containing protein [Porphyromonas crevioricanis]|uniref:hypothetical protein n=1 Tax=Porphyromonas crevioricanis TaxID=393921 RepID=UPI00118112C4|nr:hypothetical protein [Porphyromonas crevioricanis]